MSAPSTPEIRHEEYTTVSRETIVHDGAPAAKAALASEDAERAVLAAVLIDERVLTAVVTQLEPSHFSNPRHRLLFEAMVALGRAGARLDPITLADAVQRAGHDPAPIQVLVGGLYDEVPTSAHVVDHALVVRRFARRRELAALGRRLTRDAHDVALPIEAAFDRAGQALLEHSAGQGEAGFQHIKADIFAAMERIDQRRDGTAPAGLRSGWPELDDRLHGGFDPGTLVTVVGVPSSGKTSFVLNLLANLALDGVGATAMVSAEMTRSMLIESLLASAGDVPRVALKTGDLSSDQARKLGTAAARLIAAPIYVDDTVMPDVEDVVNRCTLLKAQHPDLVAVGVDFIQLLQRRNKDRGELHEATLRHIAYALKGMAMRLNLVVFATAQPNDKQIEDRDDKRPQLRDIQGSSGIRQASDLIALIYRPQQYNPGADDAFEVNLAKSKFGALGLATLRWEGPYVRVWSPRRRQYELEAKRAREAPLAMPLGEASESGGAA